MKLSVLAVALGDRSLDKALDFHGQDVLLLYSTLVLNNSSTIK